MNAWSGGDQLWLMGGEALIVGGLLLALFRLRAALGTAPLYIALGAFQYMQVVLAASVYVEVMPGVVVSPGSVVLFTATLSTVLLVYIREDALEARKLAYGLLASNVILSLLGYMFGLHLRSDVAVNYLSLPHELFIQSPRLLLIGTVVLVLDIILLMMLYEAVSRVIPSLFARLFLSLATLFTFDTLLFTTAGFLDHPAYRSILVSGILAKGIFAGVYSALLAIYLHAFEDEQSKPSGLGPDPRDLFHLLTYRQRYEVLAAKIVRDPLTGVRNRGFFDDILPREVEIARRNRRTLALLMIDVDHFKQINDEHGHLVGDEVIQAFARYLESSTRLSDFVCRYGGEEFVVILPGSDNREAAGVADKIRASLASVVEQVPTLGDRDFTVTIGVASFPEDGKSAEDLISTADHRLYVGKGLGRDRVVSGGPRPVRQVG